MRKYNEQALSAVAFYGVGLLPIVMVCTSALNAIKFGAILIAGVALCSLLYFAFKPIINNNVRIPCYMFLIIGVEYLIDSVLSEFMLDNYGSVSSLVSYLFVATIIIYIFETSYKSKPVYLCVVDAGLICGEYILCMFAVGLVREILGFGTMFGAKLFNGGIELFASSVGAVLLIGVYAIVYNLITASLKKKRKAYYGLIDRYEMFLCSKYLELQPLEPVAPQVTTYSLTEDGVVQQTTQEEPQEEQGESANVLSSAELNEEGVNPLEEITNKGEN